MVVGMVTEVVVAGRLQFDHEFGMTQPGLTMLYIQVSLSFAKLSRSVRSENALNLSSS